MLIAYVALLSCVGVVVTVSFALGNKNWPRPVGGIYVVEPTSDHATVTCLGGPILRIVQSGKFLTITGGTLKDDGSLDAMSAGKIDLQDDGRINGPVKCAGGSSAGFEVSTSVGRKEQSPSATLTGTLGGKALQARLAPKVTLVANAGEARDPENTFGRLMLAIAAVILAARLMGSVVAKISQPRVMGEVIAGILLGPSLLKFVLPWIQAYLFPPDIVPLLTAGADVGLVFYMFLVGLELDPGMLRGRVEQAAFISHASIAVPMALGIATAVPLFALVGPSSEFIPFALFMGVAMSVTAFPVLARILVERRMLKRPVGAIAISAAAIDDVTAWVLIALSSGVALSNGVANAAQKLKSGDQPCWLQMELSVKGVCLLQVIVVSALFIVFMTVVARRLLARVGAAYDEAGHVPAGWMAAIFLGVLLSAYASAQIPIAAIFGAFVMGLVMPRRADVTHDVTRRVEGFVVTVLLPLFFVVTGLRTQIGLLDRPILWLLTLALIVVAVVGKWVGAMAAARFTGLPMRQSAAIGCLMNTRGLTELIVLNIGLDLRVITPTLFTMLVVMALVTTFMTGPALRLIDRRGEMSAPAEEELQEAERVSPGLEPALRLQGSILVAPQDAKNIDPLLALAEPLTRSQPPRELILVRLLEPARLTTGLATDQRELQDAVADVEKRRDELVSVGVSARAVAFTTGDVGEDLLRLASDPDVDLLLIDGRRPLLGEGVPRGVVGKVLEQAQCDVAVLVEREVGTQVGPARPLIVPFGGADHDWAALELAAWIASARSAPLKLLGAAADLQEGKRDASRLLANASLAVQQLAGVAAEVLLVPPGRDSVILAAQDAGLLVVGLSQRWRQEGLGPVRSAIAKAAPAPVLFVRRGARPGALAPRGDVPRFTWSSVAPSAARNPEGGEPV